MSTFPSLTGKRLINHHFLIHKDGRCTVVPVHGNETTGRGLLVKILRDADLTKEELQEKL
ncbi:MAG: addiction module toxin, HicA family [Candidatus Electrothrix sp. AX5]|nr:addiction module toxin, HicA family [Candidatus Electrothrix sp. AX5]